MSSSQLIPNINYNGEVFSSTEFNNNKDSKDWSRLAIVLTFFGMIILSLFFNFVTYPTTFAVADDVQYVFYLNVTVMMLVGFGFLMTFQRLNALTAIGMTFLVTALSIPWAVLTGRFFASVAGNLHEYPGVTNSTLWGSVELDVSALLQGNFAAATVLISFGAVIGKITPSQLVMMTFLEVPLYSLNKEVFCIGKFLQTYSAHTLLNSNDKKTTDRNTYYFLFKPVSYTTLFEYISLRLVQEINAYLFSFFSFFTYTDFVITCAYCALSYIYDTFYTILSIRYFYL